MINERRGLAKAATLIALGNITSRILGLARTSVVSGLFGATGTVSAFDTAMAMPRQLYELLIGGMVSSALVPVFSEYAEKDKNALWQIVSLVLSMVVTVVGVVILLAELLAPALAWWLGGSELDLLLLTRLLRLMLPAMLLMSLSGVITGLLYAMKQFVYPAFTAAVFNAAIVVVALAGALAFKQGIEVVAVGLVLGSLAQVLLQLPGLKGAKLRYAIDWKHPVLRKILRLYRPIVLGLMVTFVQVLVDRRLANSTGQSSVAWMERATTLVQFPIGLVAVAISQAILPTLSRYAAEILNGHNPQESNRHFADTLFSGIKIVLILIIPATAALFVLAEPIIRLLFEHGNFTPFDTAQTALALRFYLVGLTFAAVDQQLVFAFYARQDTFTPAMVGIASVGVYLAAALGPLLFRPLQMTDLVLADGIKHISHVAMMFWFFRRWSSPRGHGLSATTLKAGLAALAMTGVLWAGLKGLAPILPPGVAGELALITLLGVAGGSVYLLVIWRFGVEEAALVFDGIRKKLLHR